MFINIVVCTLEMYIHYYEFVDVGIVHIDSKPQDVIYT